MMSSSIDFKLQRMKDQANFLQEEHMVRDGVYLYVFVRHEGYDSRDNLLPETGLSLPGAEYKTEHKKHEPDTDPAVVESSSEEEEEIDYDDDTEEPSKA